MNQRVLNTVIARAAVCATAGLFVAGVGCHETTGPRPDNSRPVLTRHADTVTAIGDTVRLAVNNASNDVVWESRDNQVALVTQTGRVTAMRVGETWVLVFRQPGIADSTRLVVKQEVASVTVTPSAISRPLNRKQQFQAVAVDAKGVPVPGLPITWSTSGNAATIDGNGVATANALGTATIHATVKGIDGTATLTVSPLPALRFAVDTMDMGVGQYAGGSVTVIADSISVDESSTASLSLSDPFAQLSPATVALPEYNGSKASAPFQIFGLTPGIGRLTATAAQYTPATAVIRVSTPRLQLMGPNTWPSNAPFRVFDVTTADSLGHGHFVVQPLPIRIRATTPGVILPEDTTVTMPAAAGYQYLPLRRGASGETWIVATAPGYRPDSLHVSLLPAKLAFTDYNGTDVSTATVVVGGEAFYGSLVVFAGCCQFTDLPITITQRHPEALTVPHSLLLPAMDQNAGRVQLQPIGLQPATDTLIATAPGFLPDTVLFHITTPTFALTAPPKTSTVGSSFTITTFVADSSGSFFFPVSGSKRALVTSSDPTVLRPSSDTAVIGNSTGGGSFRLDALGPGTATITLTDPSGVFAPATTAPIVVMPTKLLVTSGYPPTKLRSVGMHQLVDGMVHIATGGSIADSIRLRSTDPTVARPTTNALPGAGSSFSISGGERSGVAWIVASGPGLISDSLQVTTGRPTISVLNDLLFGTVGQSGVFVVQLRDPTGAILPSSETVTFRIESTDPNVITADSTITVSAGQSQSAPTTVRFVGAGLAVLRVVDDRNVPYAYEPGASAIIQVTAPPSTP